jgi:lipid-A-disaccharide synthase
MKYYLIAGEASGDLHGSNLIKAIRQQDPEAECRIWGGDLMEAAGGTLVKHYRDLAFMGFVEVARNLRTILRNIAFCQKDILEFQPDCLVLIDYPGFNLRIAKWARPLGLKIVYYISPQIWAWHRSRVYDIKKNVDRMLVILPFEAEFYAKYDYQADFVGHPLLDVVTNYLPAPDFHSRNRLTEQPIVALLPGSRRQEISRMLDKMLAMAPLYPQYNFVIGAAPSIPLPFYEDILQSRAQPANVFIVQRQTYDLLAHAHAALVTSGTATLETALFGVPEVVCYRGGALSYWIARRLVDVKYISLVNLIADQPLVKELIQNDLNIPNLQTAFADILEPDHRNKIQEGYAFLREKLGQPGASARAAALVIEAAK